MAKHALCLAQVGFGSGARLRGANAATNLIASGNGGAG